MQVLLCPAQTPFSAPPSNDVMYEVRSLVFCSYRALIAFIEHAESLRSCCSRGRSCWCAACSGISGRYSALPPNRHCDTLCQLRGQKALLTFSTIRCFRQGARQDALRPHRELPSFLSMPYDIHLSSFSVTLECLVQSGKFIPEKSNIWRDCVDGYYDWVKEHIQEVRVISNLALRHSCTSVRPLIIL